MLAGVACKDPPRESPPPSRAGLDASTPPIAGWPALAGFVLAEPLWLVDMGPQAPRPEIAAHAPIVVGERIVVAGSRVGYVGLDRDRGEIAWRRPGGAWLSAPLVLAHDDVVLVRECDEAVGAPPGQAVLACLDRLDPIATAARTAERIFSSEDSVGDCLGAGAGPWRLEGADPAALILARGRCRFTLALPGGHATRLADSPPPAPLTDDELLRDGDASWRQRIDGRRSLVVRGDDGPSLPGLTVIAAARLGGLGSSSIDAGAVVVRADASLRRDYLAAYDARGVAWVWPLPPPPDGGRGGPIGVAASARDILVFFDGGRVARFTAPWAGATAR